MATWHSKILLLPVLPFLLGSNCMQTTPEEVSAEGSLSIPEKKMGIKFTIINKRALPPPPVPKCTVKYASVSISGGTTTISETKTCE